MTSESDGQQEFPVIVAAVGGNYKDTIHNDLPLAWYMRGV